MDISIIIPLKNEEESLPELCEWIVRVMEENSFRYEIILVDDGSTDFSWKIILGLSEKNNSIKGIRFQRNYGKSAALNEGFKSAKGKVVITMDADLQDSPDEIPELYRMITQDGYDMVSGWKKKRHDNTFTKNLPSKFFNWVTKKMTHIQLHDFNCGLKAYRCNLVKSIEVYGEMHRYIPVISKWSGFTKIGEKVVIHRPRKYGVSKFGWERMIGLLDLLSIMFVGKFAKKPMHFFGLLGSLVFFIGFCIWIYLGIAKIIFHVYNMTDRPIFYIGLISLMIGTQLFLTGFLAELIARNASERNHYLIGEKIGIN
ncbi:MAG: glycosyltransferase family 2 protein [Chitinophagaceae bacterium]